MSDYQEQELRRRMLHLLREWVNQQDQSKPILRYPEFINLMGLNVKEANLGGEEAQSAANELRRFMQLVNNGYVDASYKSEFYGGPAWTIAWVTGLTDKGLREMGYLPDPRQEVLALLDNMAEAINALSDEEAPPEQKKAARRGLTEVAHFVRGLSSSSAVEFGSRFLS